MTNSTQSIESIDLQIKELQEQKRRLIETQRTAENKVVFDMYEIIGDANKRLHKVLIDAGVKECDVLSFVADRYDILDWNDLTMLQVMNSSGKFLFSLRLSVTKIYEALEEIISVAIALEKVNSQFKHLLKEDDGRCKYAIHLVTEIERLDVYLRLCEDGVFNVEVDESIKLDDSEEVYVRFGKDSDAFVNIEGLNLSASFGYKKENVSVSELADVLTEIDLEFKNMSVNSYRWQ